MAHVDVLMRSDVEPATRTADAGQDAPLCYIAQFEGGGYAILGANDKQAPVVAYVPKGSLTAQELADAKAAADRGEDHETPTYINACVVEYLQDAAEGLVENEAETITRSGGPIEWPFKPIPDRVQLLNTTWHQDAPYNNYCPIQMGQRTKVGCIALALGQILAYNKKTFNIGPDKLVPLNGIYTQSDIHYPNWSSITRAIETSEPNVIYQYDIQKYLYALGRAVGMQYGINESNAKYLDGVVPFLKKVSGYKDIEYRNATLADIKTQLQFFNVPVFACGSLVWSDSKKNAIDHAWVIDGWEQRTEWIGMGDGFIGDLPRTIDYVHCLFGYKDAQYDGWIQYNVLSGTRLDAYRLGEIIFYTI